MPKRLRDNELTKETLTEMIRKKDGHKDFDPKDHTRLDLLLKAKDVGIVITDEQMEASIVEKHTTVKCYLKTIVKDEVIIDAMNAYVSTFSLLWTRCLALLNLLVLHHSKIDSTPRSQDSIDKAMWTPKTGSKDFIGDTLYDAFFKEHSPKLLMHLFLPKILDHKKLHPLLKNEDMLSGFEDHTRHLFPMHWSDVMMLTGWYGGAKHASTTLKTCIGTMTRRLVSRKVLKYVENLEWGIDSKKLTALIKKPWPQKLEEDIPRPYLEHLQALRTMMGMESKDRLPNFPPLSKELFDFYLHLCKAGFITKSVMPKGALRRKFAYFDELVLKNLFKKHMTRISNDPSNFKYETTLMKKLGFSKKGFEERHKELRRTHRKKPKTKKGSNKTSTRKRKGSKKENKRDKWANKGKMKLHKNAIIRSFKSDGVSLCLSVAYKPSNIPLHYKKPLKKNITPKERERMEVERITKLRVQDKEDKRPITFMGFDLGRAKLGFGAMKSPLDEKPSYHVFSRKSYHYHIGLKRTRRSTKARLEGNQQLKEAQEALATSSKDRGFIEYLRAQMAHFQVLFQAHIEDTHEAHSKMHQFRLKQSCLAKAANRLLDSGVAKNNGRLVVGIGDAKFAPGGKGETSVPIQKFREAMNQAKKQKEGNRKSGGLITFIKIDEFRTTKCCCKCDGDCEKAEVEVESKTNANKKSIKTHTKAEASNQDAKDDVGGSTSSTSEEKVKKRSSRLMHCTECGGIIDRDKQASENILRLTQLKYEGKDRPKALSRQAVACNTGARHEFVPRAN